MAESGAWNAGLGLAQINVLGCVESSYALKDAQPQGMRWPIVKNWGTTVMYSRLAYFKIILSFCSAQFNIDSLRDIPFTP